MLSDVLHRIRGISLIWKLLIPFAFFSFAGTTILVYIGLSSQEDLIKKEEKAGLLNDYKLFQTHIKNTGEKALGLSTIIASDSNVKTMVTGEDREGLEKYLLPVFHKLKSDFGIRQFHVHIPPGKSFLRLHIPEEFGEMLPYRSTVRDSMKTGKGIAGLEWGVSGLGIRGVAPIMTDGLLVGSVEIGYPFGPTLLNELKENWGPDFTVFEKRAREDYSLLATTHSRIYDHLSPEFLGNHEESAPLILIAPGNNPDRAILLGPVKDYSGEIVGLVQVDVNRSAINERLAMTRKLMVIVGIAGIGISFFLVWVVASLFTKPIEEIVKEAREIAEGEREIHLDARPNDEIGMLTDSLNIMLDSLIERRRQVEEYARTLERKVQDRTEELVSSEEKYRTLVENLPLIVYRLLEDGTTEFVNPYFSEKLGYSVDEAVGTKNFWFEKICGHHDGQPDEMLEKCFQENLNVRVERVVKDKDGQSFTFIDHAIPRIDEKNGVKAIEGIMVDITELKELQEKSVRIEEIRLLGEISSRFAHEIRNPLATAGGFARRLKDSLPGETKAHEFARIIVEEVARLESLLKIILSSLEEEPLCISEVDLNGIFEEFLEENKVLITTRKISVDTSFSPANPQIQADKDQLTRALENLLRCAILSIPEGSKIFLQTLGEPEKVVITIRHRAEKMGDEDVEQFFFPRFTAECDTAVQGLPLSKIIIHRHGGKVDVFREDKDLAFKIELPVRATE
jgi:PAS domain S-box-containing protein